MCVWLSEKKKKRKGCFCVFIMSTCLWQGADWFWGWISLCIRYCTQWPHLQLQSGLLSMTEVLLSVIHEMLLVLLMNLTFSREAEKKMLFVFFLGILNLLSHPLPLQIIAMEGTPLMLWNKRKSCIVESYLEILIYKSSY